MGRGANSAAEWVVGQNFRSWGRKPSGQRSIFKVELSENEASGDETLAITFPGQRKRAGTSQKTAHGAATSSSRRVRFDSGGRPLKSALKKTVNQNDSSDTLVDNSDDDAPSTTDDGTSDPDETDTSEDDSPPRRRRSKTRKARAAVVCQKEIDSEDSSAAKNALPDPSCPCDDCRKGRKIMKAMVKFEAKTKAAREAKTNHKGKKNGRKGQSSSTDATDTATTDAGSTEADTSEGEATEEEKPKPKKGKTKKQKNSSNENAKPAPKTEAAEPEHRKKAVNKAAFRMPQYPREKQPNLIMPPRARVVRVEHAVEGPTDPHPNAFYDTAKGITRVYHGPQFSNGMAQLYENGNLAKAIPTGPGPYPQQVWPFGWQEGQHPYAQAWLPAPPAGSPGSPLGQMPDNEAAMKEAASKGLGLSGMPAVPVPDYIQKEMQKDEAQKAGSDKGSKKAAWDGPAWDAAGNGNNGDNQAFGRPSSPPAGPSQPDFWGNNNGGGGRDNSASKEDGAQSPTNFNAWRNDSPKFSRNSKNGSKNGGSQQNGPAGGWGENKNDQSNQQNAWSGGGDQNNQSTPWGEGDGDQNHQQSGWDNAEQGNNTGWGARTGDGEQAQTSPVSKAPSKPASAANGTLGDGGGAGWGANNQSSGWDNNNDNPTGSWDANNQSSGWNNNNNPAGGWGENNNGGGAWGGGSKHDSPQQSKFNTPDRTWGGPPGTFAPSNHPSRAGSDAGGNGNGGLGTSGDRGNRGQNNNGIWNGGGSDLGSPGGKPKGAFDWPRGMGPPPNNSSGQGNHHNNDWNSAPARSRTDSRGGFGTSQERRWSGSQPGPSQWRDYRQGSHHQHGSGLQQSRLTGNNLYENPPIPAIDPGSSWQNPDNAQYTGGKVDQW